MADKLENIVFVGKKPPMTYITSIITAFTIHDEVIVKARGRSISLAVDTVEILRRRFMKDIEVKSVKIATDELKMRDGTLKPVSTIEIILTRGS